MADPAASEQQLIAALERSAERGAIGERSLPVAIAHADEFAREVPSEARDAVDLGSGGGLPGLVVAVRCPWLELVLVERRRTRADMLERAVRSLELGSRVRVAAADVRTTVPDLASSVDVVTARSFAAPAVTAGWASQLLRPGGRLLVSEPPADTLDRWPAEMLDRLGLVDLGRHGHLRVFQRR